MQKNIFTTITTLMLLFPIIASAQMLRIKGEIRDSSGAAVPNVSVMLTANKDNSLAGFAATNEKGFYQIDISDKGSYLFQATAIGFSEYAQSIDIQKSITVDVLLKQQDVTLKELAVTAEKAPMQIKKDTVEYNAQYFKTQPGSVVEDLLKKLPGVEVDASGQIKANGQQIKSVLVDGKEFFGTDPTMATKNLPADIVDKIQMFDKRSEEAEFAGIRDGNEEKTINIKLKDGKKQGNFGNLEGGYGTANRYKFKGNLNNFARNRQLSVLGLTNNTNTEGFSVREYIQFMGGLSNFASGGQGGRMTIRIGGGDAPIGDGNNISGVLKTVAGGLNWNQQYGKRTKSHLSYFINHLENDVATNTNRVNFIRDRQFNTLSDVQDTSRSLNHNINSYLKHDIDSTQNIKVKLDVSWKDATQLHLQNLQNIETTLKSQSSQDNSSFGNTLNYSSSFVYRKRLGKAGRTGSLSGSYGNKSDNRDADLYSENILNDQGSIVKTTQQQNYNETQNSYSARVNFTEPLGKNRYLTMAASRQNYANRTNKEFYFVNPGSGNKVIDSINSNRFNRDYVYHRVGLNFQKNKKKSDLFMRLAYQNSALANRLLDENLPFNAKFDYFLPSLRYEYRIANSHQIDFDYSTEVQEPSLQDLQPIIDNTNPLSIFIGNPALRPAYSHELEMHYMLFDNFNFRSIMANVGTTYTTNKINYAREINPNLGEVVRPVNVDYDFSTNVSADFSMPIRAIKCLFKSSGNFAYNRALQFINQDLTPTNFYNTSLNITLENRKKEKIDWLIGIRRGINDNRFTTNGLVNKQTFYSDKYFTEITWNVTSKFSIQTNFDYRVYRGGFETQHFPLWQASAVHYFLPSKKLRLKLTCFDILNTNNGIQRSAQFNYYQELQTNVINRYFLLSMGYSLRGFKDKEDGMFKRRGRS